MKKNNLQQVVDQAKEIIAKKDATIVLLKKKVRDANGEKSVVFKMPDTMEIENFPALQKVEVTNQKAVQDVNVLNLKKIEVEVKNHPEVQKVHVVNSEKAPEIQRVEVTNQEKASEWMPAVIISSIKSIGNLFVKLWGNGLTVRLAEEERLKPIPVYLVDKNGKPVKEGARDGSIRYGLNLPMIGRANNGAGATPTSLISSRKAIVTPGVPIAIYGSQSCKKIIFTTPPGNGGVIAIGNSAVSAVAGSESGSLLMPTGSATIEIDNTNKIYIDGTNAGDVLTFNILI